MQEKKENIRKYSFRRLTNELQNATMDRLGRIMPFLITLSLNGFPFFEITEII